MRLENGLLIADFPRGAGSAAIRIAAKDQYFTVTAAELKVPDAERFTFFQLSPAPNEYIGNMAGLASDDASGVCLRSLALEVDTSFHSPVPQFRASTTAEHGLVGHSIGLAAGPRPQLIPMLRSMAENEPVPKSRVGGPWDISPRSTCCSIEIPAKGKVDILVSPIVSLTARRAELANPSLEIGGSKVVFPVTLRSGQYIELEGIDDCVLYDERGELIRRFRRKSKSCRCWPRPT